MPPRRRCCRSKRRAGEHFKAPWKKLFTSRTVWCLCGQYFACSYSFWFFITWFPTYLLKARHFDIGRGSLMAGIPLFLGACGSLFAGWVSPILSRRAGGVAGTRRGLGSDRLRRSGLPADRATWLTNPYLAVAAIALVGFCNDIQLPGAWTACMDVGGKSVATLSGTMNMMGNVGGFVSPIVCGYIVEAHRQLEPGVLCDGRSLCVGRLLLAGHGPGHAT